MKPTRSLYLIVRHRFSVVRGIKVARLGYLLFTLLAILSLWGLVFLFPVRLLRVLRLYHFWKRRAAWRALKNFNESSFPDKASKNHVFEFIKKVHQESTIAADLCQKSIQGSKKLRAMAQKYSKELRNDILFLIKKNL